MTTFISGVQKLFSNATAKLGGKRRRTRRMNKTMTMGGSGKGKSKLPTSTEASVKRAKKAIQKYILDKSKTDKKRETVEAEIENANKHGRKGWNHEVLIRSNQGFNNTVRNNSHNWYVLTSEVQWSLKKMPDWAKSGNDQPEKGEMIEGSPYILA
uniref:Uncharacterized protein n=1 Tax=viral metagenome TaxID=1070528 RepID=A0A6C0JJH7_9ZZZZ